MTFPGTAHSGVVSYNLADYSSPLTKRVTIPPNWFPSPGAQGYSGALDVTWFAGLASDSDQVTLSQGHAIQIGAPRDFTLATGPDNCWGMLMNFGLITLGSTSDLVVSLSADAKQSSSLAPAFALFQGWDTGANSSRHQTITFGSDNPLGSSGLKFIGDAYGNNQSGSVKKTFSNLPAGTYELFVTNRSNSGSYGSYRPLRLEPQLWRLRINPTFVDQLTIKSTRESQHRGFASMGLLHYFPTMKLTEDTSGLVVMPRRLSPWKCATR